MQLPDVRGWALLGLFVLVIIVLALLACDTSLKDNQLFETLSTTIVTGGFLGAVNYFFGSSQGSADKDKTISKQIDKEPSP